MELKRNRRLQNIFYSQRVNGGDGFGGAGK